MNNVSGVDVHVHISQKTRGVVNPYNSDIAREQYMSICVKKTRFYGKSGFFTVLGFLSCKIAVF